jgi:hypothetical protein
LLIWWEYYRIVFLYHIWGAWDRECRDTLGYPAGEVLDRKLPAIVFYLASIKVVLAQVPKFTSSYDSDSFALNEKGCTIQESIPSPKIDKKNRTLTGRKARKIRGWTTKRRNDEKKK